MRRYRSRAFCSSLGSARRPMILRLPPATRRRPPTGPTAGACSSGRRPVAWPTSGSPSTSSRPWSTRPTAPPTARGSCWTTWPSRVSPRSPATRTSLLPSATRRSGLFAARPTTRGRWGRCRYGSTRRPSLSTPSGSAGQATVGDHTSGGSSLPRIGSGASRRRRPLRAARIRGGPRARDCSIRWSGRS